MSTDRFHGEKRVGDRWNRRFKAASLIMLAWLLRDPAQLHAALGDDRGILTAKPTPKPKPCLPEGKHTNDPGRCCSKSTMGNICCGVSHDSCAISGCCDPAGDTPHCYQGSCVACFPEGAQADAANCCSHAALNGVCCAEDYGSCQNSGCCAQGSTPICHEGFCVPCLPDGAPVTNGDETICCSGSMNDAGQCCGESGATCATSLCCTAGATCDETLTCQPCLAEGQGSQTPNGADCCSGAANDAGQCCGEVGASCAVSLCCGGGAPCDGQTCQPCLAEGQGSQTPDGADCCSGAANDAGQCCGELGTSCAVSLCCAGGTPCDGETCQPCLADGQGSQTPDGADCCSGAANAAGQCCGEVGATCAASLCCADGANCDGQTCRPCLAEGVDSFNFDGAECCSLAENSSGLCCGEVGASCATSLCCGDGARCDGQTCQPCLAEGENSQTLDGADCCSLAANVAGLCCGEAGDFCATSLCCAEGAICDGQICFACLAEGSATTSPTQCCSGSAQNGVCCSNAGASCSSDGDCCDGACCNGVCTDTATDPSNCGSCANNCPTFFGGQGPNTCQNGICGHQCTWPSNSPCPPPADIPFCQFFETCVQSCLINGNGEIAAPPYVICCGTNNCGDQAPRTCGDGACCCGGCNLATFTCCGSRGDSCATDADCCPGMVCDEAFGGCNNPN